MIIGTKELPDSCPICETPLIKVPMGRTLREGSMNGFSYFKMQCPSCKFETDAVKIREDYLIKEMQKAEDVTPYDGFFKRMFKSLTR